MRQKIKKKPLSQKRNKKNKWKQLNQLQLGLYFGILQTDFQVWLLSVG